MVKCVEWGSRRSSVLREQVPGTSHSQYSVHRDVSTGLARNCTN